MVSKNLVKLSFSRFAENYNREAYIQEKASKDLIEFGKENIRGLGLDLGSGTGYISKNLKGFDCYLINLDISREMLKQSKIGTFLLIQGDIENLPFKNNSFDFVLSSFSLHWTNLNKSFKEINRILKEDSHFIFNIPIKGSLEFINFLLKSEKFKFLSKEDVLLLLEKYNFRLDKVKILDYCINFEDGYRLLLHLHKTGVSLNTNDNNFKRKRLIVSKFKNWQRKCSLNYKLLYVKVKK